MAPRFVYWLLAGAAILFVVLAGGAVVQAWRMRRWLATTAVVTGNRLESDDSGREMPYLVYEYVVDGQRHRGEGAVNDRYEQQRKVLAILAKHPVGSQVRVHYSPESPSRSTLRRHGWMAIVAAALLFSFACDMAFNAAYHLL